jgi:hypothetical protein
VKIEIELGDKIKLTVGNKGEVTFDAAKAAASGLDFGAVFVTGLERILGDRAAGDADLKGPRAKVAAWESGKHVTGGGGKPADHDLNMVRAVVTRRHAARGKDRTAINGADWKGLRAIVEKREKGAWAIILKDLAPFGIAEPK